MVAKRSADEGRDRQPDDALRRAAEEGEVRRESASERAAELAADDDDTPMAPDDPREPGVRAVPPVIPGGAAANMSVDSTSASAGGQTGPAGSPAAAAILAGEVAFSQDDVKTGWDVVAADDAAIGTVEEVGPERILVDRTDQEGKVYVPYTAIHSLDNKQVHLAVPSGLIDQQDWQQVLPGGLGKGPSPPPRGATIDPSASSVGDEPAARGQSHSAASDMAEPRQPDLAGPVTTGRGVEEGPTQQTIRVGTPGTHAPSDPSHSEDWDEPVRPLAPTRTEQHDTRDQMQSARDMMGNVRNTFQGGPQGQINPEASKEAFADMFSFLENIPNSFYYLATVASVFASLVLFVTGKRWESLFVGLWAPTIVSASMFYKLLRPSHEVRQM